MDVNYNNRKYKKEQRVVALNTEPSDNVRGVFDGAVGIVEQPELRDKGMVYRCPLVKFEKELCWMGMHQLDVEQ